jgi:PAS domain S-box-containing protein
MATLCRNSGRYVSGVCIARSLPQEPPRRKEASPRLCRAEAAPLPGRRLRVVGSALPPCSGPRIPHLHQVLFLSLPLLAAAPALATPLAGREAQSAEQWVTLALLIAVALCAALLCRNFSLRRSIREKTDELTREIMASRRQGEELRLSEERFQAIFNLVNDAIFIHDSDTGAILEVNQRMCEMYGYTQEEARRLHLHAISSDVAPYTAEHAQEWLRKAAQGTPQLFEWQAKAKDGRLFWVEVNVRRAWILEHDSLLVTARDISDRKLTESALRDAQATLSKAFQLAPVIFTISEPADGTYVEVNQMFEQLSGFTREEAIGRTSVELGWIARQDREKLLQALKKEGRVSGMEMSFTSKTGRKLLSWYCAELVEVNGKERILSICLDITEQKRAEKKFRDIFENAPIAIFQSTIAGRFLSVNPAAATVFGYQSPEQLLSEVVDIPRQLFERPEQREELIRCALQSDLFVRREIEYRRRDGSHFIANIHVRLVRDEEGEVQFMEGFVEDITERKRSEELTRILNAELEQRVSERTMELEQINVALKQEVESRKRAQLEIGCLNEGLLRQRAALESANKELESFSYSVSHDLRAPLRHLSGYAGLLMEDFGAALDEKARGYLEKINISSIKMQELIDGLLSLSRVIRGDLNTVPLDLSFYARDIAQALQQAEPAREVSFIIAEHVPATADPVLIRSVLENLLGNAWKYSGKSDQAQIEFGSELQRGERVYYVRDNGAGFDMAYAGKLFGVFQRMHSATEFEGTGIGLATVQRIIHRHGGRIWAEAEIGKGATFYFTLG